MFFFPIVLKTIASSWQKWCIIGWIFSTLVLHVREINSNWKIYILVLINLLINCGILSSLLLWEYIYVYSLRNIDRCSYSVVQSCLTLCDPMACQCRRRKTCGFDPWVGKLPWRRKWQPNPVFLPGESHGQRSLACYSP